jgi:hypothetical protein
MEGATDRQTVYAAANLLACIIQGEHGERTQRRIEALVVRFVDEMVDAFMDE